MTTDHADSGATEREETAMLDLTTTDSTIRAYPAEITYWDAHRIFQEALDRADAGRCPIGHTAWVHPYETGGWDAVASRAAEALGTAAGLGMTAADPVVRAWDAIWETAGDLGASNTKAVAR